MLDLVINSSITHSLMFVLPICCALLLYRARTPGWAVVGGAVAGILIGPTVLGRLSPAAFEGHFVGGAAERVALEAVLRRHEIEHAASVAAQRDPTALADLAERHEAERRAAEDAWREARWSFQRPLRSYTVAIITLTLLGAGAVRGRGEGPRPGWIAPSSIGLWAAAVPAGLAFAAARWLFDLDARSAGLAAAAVAIGPWVLTGGDREAAEQAELGGARLVEASGRVASIIAIAAAGACLWLEHGLAGLGWAAPLLALPAGRLLPAGNDRGRLRLVIEATLVPSLTACVASKIDLLQHAAFWPLVVFLIVSGDGRGLGAFVGAMVPGGRRSLRTMRLVLGSMACGPTQLAIAALAAHTWSLPATIVHALLIGAVAVEVTTPARRFFARRLIETEQELADQD